MADLVNYSCPNCGGKLVFSAEKQAFACEWCLSEFTEQQMQQINSETVSVTLPAEQTAEAQHAQTLEHFENSANLYICDSCGAEIIADENTAATFCYYCHSPVALKGRLNGIYCPEKIIPFKKSKDDAEKAFKAWIAKKKFLPNSFKSEATLEKITGMYVPFWVASGGARGHIIAEGEITHSTKRGNTITTKHDVYRLERAVAMRLDKIPADASQKIDDHLMDTVEPFGYEDETDFSMAYLQGFYADKYDVTKEEVVPRIKSRAEDFVKSTLMESLSGYSAVRTIEQSAEMNISKWQYMMLPVWFLNYKHNGKDYPFAMNGQTGKFVGELPVSVPKMLFGAFITALTVLVIGGVFCAAALY